MSGDTNIAWATKSWNPTTGCTRVSAGCDHCYAFQLHDQRHVAWKRGRMPSAAPQYHLPFSTVQLLPERLEDPLHWRKPERVFVDSMSDLWHDDVPLEYLERVFDTMLRARQHTYLILTKRPERMCAFMEDFRCFVEDEVGPGTWEHTAGHIWLGVSVEDQAAADERIPWLMRTPAVMRFLSCEPLIGRLELGRWVTPPYAWLPSVDWVIVGGESGPHARPCPLPWITSIASQCLVAQRPVFVKQLGSVWARENHARHPHGGDPAEWPAGVQAREFPAQAVPV